MGYRLRLGKVAQLDQERYNNKSYKEVVALLVAEAPDSGCTVAYPWFHTQLYEIGKYVNHNNNLTPFYTGFDIKEEYEAEFHIMPKEILKLVIEEYHELIWQNYAELAKHEGDCWEDWWKDTDCVQHFLDGRERAWRNFRNRPYRLDENKGCDGEIASSWQYEYMIFNLVYIYRTFDWDNDYLIYSGW